MYWNILYRITRSLKTVLVNPTVSPILKSKAHTSHQMQIIMQSQVNRGCIANFIKVWILTGRVKCWLDCFMIIIMTDNYTHNIYDWSVVVFYTYIYIVR